MNLTASILQAGCGCTQARSLMWLPPLQQALRSFSIDTPQRISMFLANLGHESGRLAWVREIWGPKQVPEQVTYERDFASPWPATVQEAQLPRFARNRKAFGMGNVNAGDGRRYVGRGLIQLTGRANAVACRDGLRAVMADVPDFEASPELLELPQWAALSAAWFWSARRLNTYADANDFDGVCDVINRGRKTVAVGDSNGYADRAKLWESARAAVNLM